MLRHHILVIEIVAIGVITNTIWNDNYCCKTVTLA